MNMPNSPMPFPILRVCTWNVNGLRALPGPMKPLLDSLQSDVICLQETKCSRDLDGKLACVDGYNSYFSHCTHRPGYSGVAIYCRDPIRPFLAADGFVQTVTQAVQTGSEPMADIADFLCSEANISRSELKSLEAEGRLVSTFLPASSLQLVSTDHELQNEPSRPVCILSVYVPRIREENEKRVEFRRLFERTFGWLVRFLTQSNHVVICGDLNVCHTARDHCDVEELSKNESSLSLTARQWLNELLVPEQRDPSIPLCNAHGQFVDVFRHVHPTRTNAFTCWSTRTGARATNYGVRLDYILLDRALMTHFNTAAQLNQSDLLTEQTGSDHCPVWANLPLRASGRWDHPWPALCSRHWPQCQRKQTKLAAFVDVCGSSAPARLFSAKLENCASQVLHSLAKDTSSTSNPVPDRNREASGAPRLKQAKLLVAPAFVRGSTWLPSNGSQTQETLDNEAATVVELKHTEHTPALPHVIRETEVKQATESINAWRNILTGPKKPPLCRGHSEPCVLRTVKQECTASGARRGKRFWVCGRPQGAKDNPMARCNTFIWDDQYQDRRQN